MSDADLQTAFHLIQSSSVRLTAEQGDGYEKSIGIGR